MKRGDKIVYKAKLGMVRDLYSTRFFDTVEEGDTGTYIEPHKKLGEKDWHLTKPDKNPDSFVPVHISHIGVAS